MIETGINEIGIVEYFEEQPIEKATLLYNLVRHKMEKRLQGPDAVPSSTVRKKRRSSGAKSDGAQPEISDTHSV